MKTLSRMPATFFAVALAAAIVAAAAANLRATSPDFITLTVIVTDAGTGHPVNQAQLTLTFKEPGSGALSRAKTVSYSSKTDAQGRGRFLAVPAGDVTLFVTHHGHQTFGKVFQVSKEHPTLAVKLKPPQPIL